MRFVKANLREYGLRAGADRHHGVLPVHDQRHAVQAGQPHATSCCRTATSSSWRWACCWSSSPATSTSRVGSVAGFIGARGRHDDGHLRASIRHRCRSIVCLVVGAAIGAAQGYLIAYSPHPDLHRDAGRHADLQGPVPGRCSAAPRSGRSRRIPAALSSGFIPDLDRHAGDSPTVNAAGKAIVGSGHRCTILIVCGERRGKPAERSWPTASPRSRSPSSSAEDR